MTQAILLAILLTGALLVLLRQRHRKWSLHLASMAAQVAREARALEGTVDLSETESLPAPVKRYFQHVLKDGMPMISCAELAQRGGFRTKPDAKNWSPFTARQVFSVSPRGFVWNAKIAAAPGVSVRVLDAYRNGEGMMTARLFSLFPVVDAEGDERIAQGALLRFLAEAVWFPTALLPRQGLAWEAIDESRARAKVSDAGREAALAFTFTEAGEVSSVYSAGRFRQVGGEYIATPWLGRFSRYIQVQGVRVPTEAEVEWQLPDRVFAYWKATVSDIRYR